MSALEVVAAGFIGWWIGIGAGAREAHLDYVMAVWGAYGDAYRRATRTEEPPTIYKTREEDGGPEVYVRVRKDGVHQIFDTFEQARASVEKM